MAAQCQRVVLLVRDWWNDELCWRSTPFTIISLVLSIVLVIHSIGLGMERARAEVVVASLACIFFLCREAVHTVVDAKVTNPAAAAGLHYVLMRNLYSILLFAVSVLLVIHAILSTPSYWGAVIKPFQSAMLPLPPPNPTQDELLEYANQVQEAKINDAITESLHSEIGSVDVLSLLLSSFFVLCAAEWMAEVEHDLVEAERFNTTEAYSYVDGVRELTPATIFHGVCVVLSFLASVGLTIGLLATSDQQILIAVVWPGLNLRLVFILSEILQVGLAFVFAKTTFKHGLKPTKVVPVAVLLFLVVCLGWIPLFSDPYPMNYRTTEAANPVDLTGLNGAGAADAVELEFHDTLRLCIAQGFGFSIVSTMFLSAEVDRGFCKKPKPLDTGAGIKVQ